MGLRPAAIAAGDLMPRSAVICWMACAFGVGVLLASGCGGPKSPKSGSSGSGGATGSGGMTAGTGGATGGGSGTGGFATGGIGSGGAGGLATGGIGGGGRGGAPGLGTGGAAMGGSSGGGMGGAGGTGAGGASGTGGASGAGGAAGAPGVSYSGCSFVGGLDRIVVAKRDAGRNLCVVIVFVNGTNTSQVVLPQSYRVEFAFAFSPGTACEQRAPPANSILATGETGTASWTTGTSWPYGTATVDVTLAFPPGGAGLMTSETIQATAVDVSGLCK